MILRPYQERMLEQIKQEFAKGNRRIIMSSPTGSGKTAMFSAISRMAIDKGNPVLIITHRKELLGQSGGTLAKYDLTAQELTAKTKTIQPGTLYVAMVETIKSRINQPGYADFVRSFKIIIIDECHIQNFNRIFETVTPEQYVIGASATPHRDGKMEPLAANYSVIVNGVQIRELVENGFLKPAISYGIQADLSKVRITAGEFNEKDLGEVYDERKMYTGALDNYKKHANGSKFLAFSATVKNSEKLADEFNSHGIKTRHLDATTPAEERSEILRAFHENEITGICNVGILTTGFDQPDVETIILYRATKSLPLFLQMCGRGSRPAPGKQHFTILDFGNNIGRHGFWQADQRWSLEVKPKNNKREKLGEFPVKECPNCGALIGMSAMICDVCGFEIERRVKQQTKAELILLNPDQLRRAVEDATIEELEAIREARGYKIGWVLHKLETEADFKAYGKLKGYHWRWAEINYRNRRPEKPEPTTMNQPRQTSTGWHEIRPIGTLNP